MPNPTVVISIVSEGYDTVKAQLAQLQAAASPAGQSQRQLEQATAAAARSSQEQAREADRQRVLMATILREYEQLTGIGAPRAPN